MAFNQVVAGDRYHRDNNIVPKFPKAGYTPAEGDLVMNDVTIANGADLIAVNKIARGVVERVGANNLMSVALLLPGTQIELPAQATAVAAGIALGDKVEFSSNTRPAAGMVQRTRVVTDNTNGFGSVVAVDADCPHGLGHVVVEMP